MTKSGYNKQINKIYVLAHNVTYQRNKNASEQTAAVRVTWHECASTWFSALHLRPIRVKSWNFGHQVNSDLHLQTVEIQMRRLLMSRLIRIFTVCLVDYFLFQKLLYEWTMNQTRSLSEFTWCPKLPDFTLLEYELVPIWHLRPLKTQTSLSIRSVWSDSLVGALWVPRVPTFPQAENEDSVQAVQMRRLIWKFAVCKCQRLHAP